MIVKGIKNALGGLKWPLISARDRLASRVRERRNRRAERFRTEYDPDRARRFFASFVNPGDLCFDIGANVGDRTEILLSLGARVVAVEPQPSCVSSLRERFRAQDVVVVPEGVARYPGRAKLVVNERNPGLSTMSDEWRRERFPEEAWGEEIDVPVTTFDALIERFGVPSFCKIDVEGFEGEVLAGLSVPVPLLSFEFTGLFLEALAANLARLGELTAIEVNCVFYEQMRFARRRWFTPEQLYAYLERRASEDDVLSGDVYVRPKS